MTFSDPDFKVTIIQLKITRIWYNIELYSQWPTNRMIYDLSYGAIFNDLEQPLPQISRSRHSMRQQSYLCQWYSILSGFCKLLYLQILFVCDDECLTAMLHIQDIVTPHRQLLMKLLHRLVWLQLIHCVILYSTSKGFFVSYSETVMMVQANMLYCPVLV